MSPPMPKTSFPAAPNATVTVAGSAHCVTFDFETLDRIEQATGKTVTDLAMGIGEAFRGGKPFGESLRKIALGDMVRFAAAAIGQESGELAARLALAQITTLFMELAPPFTTAVTQLLGVEDSPGGEANGGATKARAEDSDA